MRPEHPPSRIHELEGDELEGLIEGERLVPPCGETEEMALPDEEPAPARSPTPAPACRTGPGRSQPIQPQRTEPMDPELHGLPPAPSPAVPRRHEGSRQHGEGSKSASARSGAAGAAERSKARSSRPGEPSQPRSAVAAAPPSSSRSVKRPRAASKSKSDKALDPLLGASLGSYRILSLLGEGGMGKVYLAEHIKLGRKVALKLLRPEYSVKRDAVARFFKEAQAVNKIGHENIVDITDFVELEDGSTFIIMEYLQGEDLSDLQRKGGSPIPLHRAMQIALQVCEALQAAHRVGVIHRDLKPDNIFIVNSQTKKDFVKLLDFGVAKLLGESTEADGWQTAVGSVIGTPAYMSPEQASGIPVDHRSDIYSLGAILYELFTGHPVFRARSFGEYVVKHINDEPVPPRNLANAPKIPAALEKVILRCLEKDPNKRYSSVGELREELARATATVNTFVETVERRKPRSRFERRLTVVLAVTAGLVGLALGSFWLASGIGTENSNRLAVRPSTVSPRTEPAAQPSPEPGEPEPTASEGPLAKLTLETDPEGADVYRQGTELSLGKTPLQLQLPAAEGEIVFVFRLAGYLEAVERISVADNALYSFPLERAPSETPAVVNPPAAKGKRGAPKARQSPGKKQEPRAAEPSPGGSQEPKPTKQKRPRKINPEEVVDPFQQ